MRTVDDGELSKGVQPELMDLLLHWEECQEQGRPVTAEQLCRDCPDLLVPLKDRIAALRAVDLLFLNDGNVTTVEQPRNIGRYRVEKLLGQGGFGRVYLAQDEQLQRFVAIKVTHERLVARSTDAEAYLTEARTVANLDHPHIVPVYDVGSTKEFPCYIVSKFIDGTDLTKRLLHSRLPLHELVELVATVAEALHYAHKLGLVHRDIKPGNILLDKSGKSFVTDFGLALREQDLGAGPRYAGTPAYMSPEQARGEGHRVDGRSDIFSLGVVFYELLVGRRPFRADVQFDLLQQITSFEPQPPRQQDDSIPRELDRICLKALAKRATERYSAAKDMADDLRHFLVQQSSRANKESGAPPITLAASPPSSTVVTGASSTTPTTPAPTIPMSDNRPIKIVPKGLRSFDAHDADFFLELLPGPRDRDGLPDSIRFWKTRIEELDADNTFSVGLIYGPSGCGKSSLVKAGLLPRLSGDTIAVYLEATAAETEARLLNGLRKRCPALPAELGLTATMAALRRGKGIPSGTNVLIVLDQFEQWLHARKEVENTELVQALRQCDGRRLKCIVMVRDDFWMAATRFMRELEIRLLDGENSAAVDLFDLDHAKRVLSAFGRAFGKIPDKTGETNKDQNEFVKQAVSGLGQDGKVICVRLALFADMMKSKSWTPLTLKEVGGTQGIGVTFLEETFSAATAPPEHRYHQKGARAILKALLPESGADIKGHMRSRTELLEASGYGSRPKDFDDLIRILDSKIRLITPTDPEGKEEGGSTKDDGNTGAVASESDFIPHPSSLRYFQLTHDYLVHSLRDWLTRKQKETRRGRAELRLEDRAALWSFKPENRHLPAWWEYVNIRLLSNSKSWTEPQSKMMHKAGRVHGMRWGTGLLVSLILGIAILREISNLRQQNLLERVQTAVAAMGNSRGPVVPRAIDNLEEFPNDMVQAELSARFSEPKSSKRQRLAIAYAMARFGQVERELLLESISDAPMEECDNLAAALYPMQRSVLLDIRQAADAATKRLDWKLKTRLAAVALQLGDPSIAADMLKADPPMAVPPVEKVPPPESNVDAVQWDPIQRTTFIDVFPTWSGDLSKLVDVLRDTQDASLRSGISLALGSVADVSPEAKEKWREILAQWQVNKPDGGTHSAAGWALQKWGLSLPTLSPLNRSPTGFDWEVTKSGLTMLRIPAGKFVQHDVAATPKTVRTVTLSEFWLSDREVTVALFQRFRDDPEFSGDKPISWSGFDKNISPTGDHPVQQVSWYDAKMFCNWLSWKEDRQPCYKKTVVKEQASQDTRNEHDAWGLIASANGYRLPTEAQWEYACRAGTTTAFSFGDDERSLGRYGVYHTTGADVVGSNLCNGWGLFDMHGNVWEWCGDWFGPHGTTDSTDPQGPPEGSLRIARGGCWHGLATRCQAANRYFLQPTLYYHNLGFRVALVP